VFGKDLNILEEASLTVRPTTQYRSWSIPVVQPTTVVLFNQAKPTLIWNRPEATRQSVGQNSGHHYRPYRTSPTTHSLTPPLVFVPPPRVRPLHPSILPPELAKAPRFSSSCVCLVPLLVHTCKAVIKSRYSRWHRCAKPS
jgi:hypothetical protein